jgi:tetratricopeptide (TPR) repeat protein
MAARSVHNAVNDHAYSSRSGPRLSLAEEYAKKGIAELDEGRLDAALVSFNRALVADEKLLAAWYGRTMVALRSDQLEDAAACAHQMTVLAPNSSEAYGMLFTVLASMERYEEALEVCRTAQSFDPHNEIFLGGIGACLTALGRPREAIDSYKAALKIKPRYFNAIIGLADALIMLGKEQKALISVDDVLRRQPLSISALCSKSNALAQMRRVDEARQYLDKAIALLEGSDRNSIDARKVSGYSSASPKRIREVLVSMVELNQFYGDLPKLFAIPSVRSVRLWDSCVKIILASKTPKIEENLRSILANHPGLTAKIETRKRLSLRYSFLSVLFVIIVGSVLAWSSRDQISKMVAKRSDQSAEAIANNNLSSELRSAQRTDRPLGIAEIEQIAMKLYSARRYADARPLFEKACSLGRADSCNYVGYILRDQLDVNKQRYHSYYSAATTFFRKACDLGNQYGCNNLGLAYSDSTDYPAAFKLFDVACDRGISEACTNAGAAVERVRDDMITPPDLARASKLYSKGCLMGSLRGCDEIGYLYFNGWNFEHNNEKAKFWFEKACHSGDQRGCKFIADIQSGKYN